MVASGVRYDLAIRSPEYVKELVTHHVGGYLKIAPEHTERGPLDKMMKPGIGTYDRFKEMFDAAAREAGKKYYLIPYFIAAHPGTTDEDMLHLALWLKKNRYRADQVQTFLPSPMATATAMYHTGVNTLKGVRRGATDRVETVRGARQRRLHKAFLRYHDPDNWPLLRDAQKEMGRTEQARPQARSARCAPSAEDRGSPPRACRCPRNEPPASQALASLPSSVGARLVGGNASRCMTAAKKPSVSLRAGVRDRWSECAAPASRGAASRSGTARKAGCAARNAATCSSFSSDSSEHVA
jgi:hypothetical protein